MQLGNFWGVDFLVDYERAGTPWGKVLKLLLAQIAELLGCEVTELQLDHDPALENRPFNKRTQKYKPDANDPNYLIYREKHAHHIKTNVRGDGAQLSDAAQARKRKRSERKKTKRKTVWPTRPLRSASRWPKRAMR
jgi:hypothetical protein